MNAVALTPRSRELLRLLCDPRVCGQKQIAHAMGVTTGTVKLYVQQIFRRLGLAPGQGSTRWLVLWAVAHRDELKIQLPAKGDFL